MSLRALPTLLVSNFRRISAPPAPAPSTPSCYTVHTMYIIWKNNYILIHLLLFTWQYIFIIYTGCMLIKNIVMYPSEWTINHAFVWQYTSLLKCIYSCLAHCYLWSAYGHSFINPQRHEYKYCKPAILLLRIYFLTVIS